MIMVYKWCTVPECKNTSIKTPEKIFVSVPTNPKRRKMWLQLARRDPKNVLSHTNIFMCEDHFDMEQDTTNYLKYKMGFSQKILLRDEAVPTKFHCQEDRKRRLSPEAGLSREVFLKRQRRSLVTECLESQSTTETEVESIQQLDNIIQDAVMLEALLIAGRLHNFSRTPADVVRIVKVHESTIRKRLIEFGETPSSALTLEEFMTVDLEEEQDPPAFRDARKRDKIRLQKLLEEEDGEKELTELQKEIDSQLEKDNARRRKQVESRIKGIDRLETDDASRFAAEDTLQLIDEIAGTHNDMGSSEHLEKGLGPDLAIIGLGAPETKDENNKFLKPEPKVPIHKDLNSDELPLSQKDEEYLSSLIMTEEEARHKTKMWHTVNSQYLKEQKIKEELRAKELAEGKKKKVRGSYKKRTAITANSAGEAIGKMIAEKKISSKINYDILKSLDGGGAAPATPKPQVTVQETKPTTPAETVPASPVPRKRRKKVPPPLAPPSPAPAPPTPTTPAPATPATPAAAECAEDYEEDLEPEPTDSNELTSLGAMLQTGDDYEYDYQEEY